jgi:hypothetical protein
MDSFLFYFTVKTKFNICQMKYSKHEGDKKDPDEGKDLVMSHKYILL